MPRSRRTRTYDVGLPCDVRVVTREDELHQEPHDEEDRGGHAEREEEERGTIDTTGRSGQPRNYSRDVLIPSRLVSLIQTGVLPLLAIRRPWLP